MVIVTIPVDRRIPRFWLLSIGTVAGAGFAGVAGSYLVTGLRSTFVVAPISSLITATTPASVLAFAITRLGDYSQPLAFGLALLVTAGIIGLTTLPAIMALQRERLPTASVLSVLIPGSTALLLTGSAGSSIGVAGGTGLAIGLTWLLLAEDATAHSDRRRTFLAAVVAATGLGASSGVIARTDLDPFLSAEKSESQSPGSDAANALSLAEERSLDVEGLEPLISTDFYEVDINTANPIVGTEEWSLTITGAVETEQQFDYADLTSLPAEDRFVTLRCVGDPLNGKKMDTALWTGVPIRRLLEQANPAGEFVMLRAEDGYYNEFPLEALWPGLLAYRMNGKPLPRMHGAPARALVPGHWGEINVKWITEIEVLERESEGYWEKRGWHGTGPVHTVAKLWQINYLQGGSIEVAGHAYAGTRGISAVEISVDGGISWTEAELSNPLPGSDVWRQWRHEYSASEKHDVVVRAIDGTGTVQKQERERAYPNGATGWVSKTVQPDAESATTTTPDWPG